MIFGNILDAGLKFGISEMQANRQHKRNLEDWTRMAEYNNPINQRKRLETAGLNPALMYGAGQGANTVGAVNPTSAPSQSYGFSKDNSIQRGMLEREAIQSEIDKNNAEAERLRGETLEPGIKSAYMKAQTTLLESQSLSESARSALLNFDLALKQETRNLTVEEMQLRNKTMKESINKLLADTEGSKLHNEELKNILALQAQAYIMNQVELVCKQQQVQINEVQKRYLEASIGLAYAETEAAMQKAGVYQKEAELKGKEAEVYKTKVYWSLVNGSIGAASNLVGNILGGGIVKGLKGLVGKDKGEINRPYQGQNGSNPGYDSMNPSWDNGVPFFAD